MTTFGSVCSGIEAASVAWGPLGWKAAWVSEIEPFPSAVLAHHYQHVPNLGDMTELVGLVESGLIEAPDILCGGTPCQAFSVAGLRKSLSDQRGNLSLTFCKLADAIDDKRSTPAIIFWENVPGVLSTSDNAFGCFLAGLAGESEPLEPPRGKWGNAGLAIGPKRTVAWRVLDAQYFGVAQRRRRVFVVASARAGFNPAAVLFEWDSVRRDTAPSREAGQGAAVGSGAGPTGSGVIYANYSHSYAHDRITDSSGVNPALTREAHASENLNVLAHVAVDTCYQRQLPGEGGETYWQRITSYELQHGITPTMLAGGAHTHAIGFHHNAQAAQLPTAWRDTSVCDALTCSQQAAVALTPVAFTTEQTQKFNYDCALTLTKQSPTGGGQVQSVMVTPINTQMATRGAETSNTSREGIGIGQPGDPAFTLQASHHHAVATAMQVRRLTPVECERLQGFPDGYTQIPWRKKPAADCPDGPRYKALGNSWAVPVVRWIGQRIESQL